MDPGPGQDAATTLPAPEVDPEATEDRPEGSDEGAAPSAGSTTGGPGSTTSAAPSDDTSTSDDGVDPSTGDPNAADTTDTGEAALSFELDIWPVFDQLRDPPLVNNGGTMASSCSDEGKCHTTPNPARGLSMVDYQSAYEDLVGVDARSGVCAGYPLRVDPGNPEQSCLVRFYEVRLRDNLGWVDDTEIDLMREWIAQGALP